MIRWIRNWWWATQRAIDLAVLWPECKMRSPDMNHAKAAFAVHAFNDPAWVEFYKDELFDVIERME